MSIPVIRINRGVYRADRQTADLVEALIQSHELDELTGRKISATLATFSEKYWNVILLRPHDESIRREAAEILSAAIRESEYFISVIKDGKCYHPYCIEDLTESANYISSKLLPVVFMNVGDDFPGRSVEPAERLAWLDEFVRKNPGEPVSELVRELFPRVMDDRMELPSVAPALWTQDRLRSDTPPDFIKRHYEPWLGKGLARSDIRRLDPNLYESLANWLRKNQMPEDMDLPTLKERNDRWVQRFEEGDLNVEARDVSRLAQAAARRRRDSKVQTPTER